MNYQDKAAATSFSKDEGGATAGTKFLNVTAGVQSDDEISLDYIHQAVSIPIMVTHVGPSARKVNKKRGQIVTSPKVASSIGQLNKNKNMVSLKRDSLKSIASLTSNITAEIIHEDGQSNLDVDANNYGNVMNLTQKEV